MPKNEFPEAITRKIKEQAIIPMVFHGSVVR
jgi:hypothetical protein